MLIISNISKYVIVFNLFLSLLNGLKADILVGVVAPLSGPMQDLGKQMKLGVSQAVTDINKSGGLLGQKLQIVSVDDL